MTLTTRWTEFAPYILGLLRIIASLLFLLGGMMKLFAFPIALVPGGGTVKVLSQDGIGAILELVGGTFLLIGLFTRPIAFVLSGMMAVAYFQFHAPQSFWPMINNGIPAILYCFIWLYFSAAGAGAWSVDSKRGNP
jgi:putative oxidoreductase